MSDKSAKYKPIRNKYVPVTEIAEDFRGILEEKVISLGNNDSYIMALLIKTPLKVRVGTFVSQNRHIRLLRRTSWLHMVREGTLKIRKRLEVREVPEVSMMAAIMRLQERLRELGTPYQVWLECRNGNPRTKKVGSRFLQKERAPFLVGLVDTRFPIKEGGV